MTKIMKKMEWYSRRTYMRNASILIQFAVGDKLYPERNRIVIQTYEPNIALIKYGIVEEVPPGEVYSLALHAAAQMPCEVEILIKHSTL